jgi:hypothetical protein
VKAEEKGRKNTGDKIQTEEERRKRTKEEKR